MLWTLTKGPSINYVVSRGEGEFKNCQFYLVKRQLRGGGGVKNCQFYFKKSRQEGEGSKIADFETTVYVHVHSKRKIAQKSPNFTKEYEFN